MMHSSAVLNVHKSLNLTRNIVKKAKIISVILCKNRFMSNVERDTTAFFKVRFTCTEAGMVVCQKLQEYFDVRPRCIIFVSCFVTYVTEREIWCG